MFRRALLARRGLTSPFGKLRNLGTLRLGTQTEELVRAEAARLRVTPIEFIRNYIEQGLHGRSVVEREHTVMLDTIERLLPQQHRKEPTD